MNDWQSRSFKNNSGCGALYVTIDLDENEKPKHCFIWNSNGCSATINVLGRLISECLAFGMPMEIIEKSLKKGICPNCVNNPESDGKSCPDIVAKILKEFEIKKLKEPF